MTENHRPTAICAAKGDGRLGQARLGLTYPILRDGPERHEHSVADRVRLDAEVAAGAARRQGTSGDNSTVLVRLCSVRITDGEARCIDLGCPKPDAGSRYRTALPNSRLSVDAGMKPVSCRRCRARSVARTAKALNKRAPKNRQNKTR